jgi:hypothetical protein
MRYLRAAVVGLGMTAGAWAADPLVGNYFWMGTSTFPLTRVVIREVAKAKVMRVFAAAAECPSDLGEKMPRNLALLVKAGQPTHGISASYDGPDGTYMVEVALQIDGNLRVACTLVPPAWTGKASNQKTVTFTRMEIKTPTKMSIPKGGVPLTPVGTGGQGVAPAGGGS